MKASELIILLQDAIDKYGDLEVSSDSDYYEDEDGPTPWTIDNPDYPNQPTELWLENK